jgi:hypothetical protein
MKVTKQLPELKEKILFAGKFDKCQKFLSVKCLDSWIYKMINNFNTSLL